MNLPAVSLRLGPVKPFLMYCYITVILQRRPAIASALFVDTQPNIDSIMPPKCVLLDGIPALVVHCSSSFLNPFFPGG